MGILHALVWALVFGGAGALLSCVRWRNKNIGLAAGGVFTVTWWLVLIEDWTCVVRPVTTFHGLLPVILLNLVTLLVVAVIADIWAGSFSVATAASLVAAIVLGSVWIAGDSGGRFQQAPCPAGAPPVQHCIREAVGLVHVTENPSDTLIASSTANLAIVTPDEAATKASTAMSSGAAASSGYSSSLDLGPATEQLIDGTVWYAFPVEFHGNNGKTYLHATAPGYIKVNAQDPNAPAVAVYAPQYPYASMIVDLGAGQGAEPDRWAYDHGYSGDLLDDPTLEIRDGDGHPFWSLTLLAPRIGQTFQAPVGVILIDAHTGQITRYALPGQSSSQYPPLPDWVDRVYGADMALRIAGWYGKYRWTTNGNSGNNGRYQVSGDPVLVYTGSGHPSWRMLLTSFGNEVSAYRILEMNTATGAISSYIPALPMGIEATVGAAFCNGQGVGAGNIRSNHLVPEKLTLLLLDGQVTWMASFEPSNPATLNGGSGTVADQQDGDNADPCGTGEGPADSPTFDGVGFVTAYHLSAANVAYGSTLDEAVANYAEQLAVQAQAGQQAGAGKTTTTITGVICAKDPDTSGGNETYYITLCLPGSSKPDTEVVYTGQSAVDGAAIVLAKPGDHVTMTVATYTAGAASQQIQSFSDAQHPLGGPSASATPFPAPGSTASATPAA